LRALRLKRTCVDPKSFAAIPASPAGAGPCFQRQSPTFLDGDSAAQRGTSHRANRLGFGNSDGTGSSPVGHAWPHFSVDLGARAVTASSSPRNKSLTLVNRLRARHRRLARRPPGQGGGNCRREGRGAGARRGGPSTRRRGRGALEDPAIEMQSRGLSVPDIEDAFKEESGRLPLWRTAVSELGARLWEDYYGSPLTASALPVATPLGPRGCLGFFSKRT